MYRKCKGGIIMPVDTEKIKKAFDEFENDNFMDSKETLQQEIKKAVDNHLKDKVDLKTSPNDLEEDEPED